MPYHVLGAEPPVDRPAAVQPKTVAGAPLESKALPYVRRDPLNQCSARTLSSKRTTSPSVLVSEAPAADPANEPQAPDASNPPIAACPAIAPRAAGLHLPFGSLVDPVPT